MISLPEQNMSFKSAGTNSELTGVITEIERYAIKDGPGIRTVVFLKGCPMKCLWCANPETQKTVGQLMYWKTRCIGCQQCIRCCPENNLTWSKEGVRIRRSSCTGCGRCADACNSEAMKLAGNRKTVSELLEEIKKDLPFYRQSGGGVTFSGGEATMQGDFLFAMLRAVKEYRMHTAIETCGDAPWETFEKIIPYLDLIFFDLKLIDEKEHIRYTGRSNRRILDNFCRLVCKGANVTVRIPIIPGVNNTEENIKNTVGFLKKNAPGIRVSLLPYHSLGRSKYEKLDMDYALDQLKPPSDEEMQRLREVFETENFRVSIGE